MTKSAIIRSIYAFFTSICLLLFAILYILITKDDWQLFGVEELICTVALFLMFPIYGITSYYFGKKAEKNRIKTRIQNFFIKKAHETGNSKHLILIIPRNGGKSND